MQNPTINGLRTYTIAGGTYYSVTTILSVSKPDCDATMLQAWKDRVGEAEARRVGDEATGRGTRLHLWCEEYCNGKNRVDEPWLTCSTEDYKNDDLARPYWKGMKPVLDEITDVKYQEVQVYHPQYRYAGTLDCYGTFRGIPNTLIDFKTASKPKRFDWIQDYCIQTVAYAGGVNHVHKHGTNQSVIIIALPNKQAQEFILCREEMIYYWGLWLKRLAVFNERIREVV